MVRVSSSWEAVAGRLHCTQRSAGDGAGDSAGDSALDPLEPGDCCRLSGAGRAGQRLEVELSAESQEEITAFALVTDCPRWEVLIGQQYFTSTQGKRLWIEYEQSYP